MSEKIKTFKKVLKDELEETRKLRKKVKKHPELKFLLKRQQQNVKMLRDKIKRR